MTLPLRRPTAESRFRSPGLRASISRSSKWEWHFEHRLVRRGGGNNPVKHVLPLLKNLNTFMPDELASIGVAPVYRVHQNFDANFNSFVLAWMFLVLFPLVQHHFILSNKRILNNLIRENITVPQLTFCLTYFDLTINKICSSPWYKRSSSIQTSQTAVHWYFPWLCKQVVFG